MKKNQIVMFGVILLVVVTGAFLYSKKKMSPVTPGNTQISEKEYAFIKDPEVRRYYASQAVQSKYRITTNSSGRGTVTITEMEISGNDIKYHAIEKDGDKEISNTIVIGDTTYLKDSKKKFWWKQTAKPMPTGEEETSVPNQAGLYQPAIDELQETEKSTFKFIKKEACGKLTCFKYEEVYTDNPEGKRYFWFDTKDYLLRKEEMGFGEFLTTSTYDYDNINITAPSPTKDVPAGKDIYEYMMIGGPVQKDIMVPPPGYDEELKE